MTECGTNPCSRVDALQKKIDTIRAAINGEHPRCPASGDECADVSDTECRMYSVGVCTDVIDSMRAKKSPE